MNNIETGYKCRMIKEWATERKGKGFNLKVVNDINGKIQKNWVLTDNQHQAIDNIWKKFRIEKWCNKKNMEKCYDDDCSTPYYNNYKYHTKKVDMVF